MSNDELKRRYFYKAVDGEGRPFFRQGSWTEPHTDPYEIGVEAKPKRLEPLYDERRICSDEALHGTDTPQGALLWAISYMLNMSQRVGLGNDHEYPFIKAISDAHPYGIRLFSFRGTPFSMRHGGPFMTPHHIEADKYGFTRLKPERELDVAKHFERPSALAKLPSLTDLFEEWLDFYEWVGDGLLSARKRGGHVWREVSEAANIHNHDFVRRYSEPQPDRLSSLDDLLDMVALRLLKLRVYAARQLGAHFSNGIGAHLSDGTHYRRFQAVANRLVARHGYERHGMNDYMVKHCTTELFIEYLACTRLGLDDYSPTVEDVATITRSRGRAIVVEVPNIKTKTPEYGRTQSLQRKIQNLIEKEYTDLGDVSVSSMQV